MQPRNNPLRTGRRRGHGVSNKTPARSEIREATELTPAKTKNRKRTVLDVKAQARRLGIGRARTPTQKALNQTPPISAYRQGRRNAKRKPEVHRSKRGQLRMSR
jgi:hypothetical protein